ncbi:MAG: hypothetical protein ACOC44_12360 [Promethearchaeia archaeon]
MSKYKICNNCKNPVEQLFKFNKNKEICEGCLWEILDEYWEHGIERIIRDIKEKFKRNYPAWKEWFYQNHSICEAPYHPIEWWVLNENLTELDDRMKYCESCIEWMLEDGGIHTMRSFFNYMLQKKSTL